jgi:hypothetical protein
VKLLSGEVPMKSWWKKQNMAIKVAWIGGCFGLVVAILGLAGSVLSLVVEKSINEPKEKVDVTVKYETYGGERFLAASNLQNPDEKYDIATNSCLQIVYGASTLKTQFNSNEWSGYINTLFITNLPVVIIKLELEIVDFLPIDPNINYKITLRYPGQTGGGGGFAKSVYTSPVIIGSKKGTFSLLENQAYELPANGSVVFSTPTTFLEPGKYTFRVNPVLNGYSVTLQPNILDEALVRWVYIPDIKPNVVENTDPDKFNLQECKP